MERLGEHHQLNEDEVAWEDASAVADSESESMCSDPEDGKMGKSRSVVADSDVESVEASADVGSSACTAVAAVASPALSEAAATNLSDSEAMITHFQQAIKILREVGAATAMQQLENEVRKERKRQRMAAMEDPAVAGALLQLKANQATMERRRRLAVEDANRREKELAKLRKESQQAQELLKKKNGNLRSWLRKVSWRRSML